MCRDCDSSTRLLRYVHYLVYFFLAAYIMTESKFGRVRLGLINLCVKGKIVTFKNGESYACLQVEKGNCPMFELLANNTFCRKSQTVAIKYQGSLQVIYPQRNNRNSRFHLYPPLQN